MTGEEYSVGFLFAVALSMVDGVVSGQVLGMDALAATSLVFPLVSLTTFLSNIITTGCSNLCAIAKGNGDHEKARSLFTLGLFATILLGLMQSVIYYFTEDLYFDYYAAPGNIGTGSRPASPWDLLRLFGPCICMYTSVESYCLCRSTGLL